MVHHIGDSSSYYFHLWWTSLVYNNKLFKETWEQLTQSSAVLFLPEIISVLVNAPWPSNTMNRKHMQKTDVFEGNIALKYWHSANGCHCELSTSTAEYFDFSISSNCRYVKEILPNALTNHLSCLQQHFAWVIILIGNLVTTIWEVSAIQFPFNFTFAHFN